MDENVVVVEKKHSLRKMLIVFCTLVTSVFSTAFAAGASEVGTGTGIANITQLVTAITGWMTSILSTILSEPLLLMMLGITVVGAVIGLVWRLVRG